MDAPDVAELAGAGELFYTTKLLMVSIHCLWVYDYLLTVGDEIKYAWSGGRSWVFALFLANRYIPILHPLWIFTVMFRYSDCQATVWMGIFHTTNVTILAQITVALRVFAVTKKKRGPISALAILIAAGLIFGYYSVIRIALGPPLSLPDIDLDVFKVCFYKRWRLGEILYISLTISFDLLAFCIIVAATKKSRTNEFPGFPNILDNIMRDATIYFVFIFASQVVFLLFMFLAPENIQLMPGAACSIFIPIMASRLMISLKKAAVGDLWCAGTMGEGRSAEDGSLSFVTLMFGEPSETSRNLSPDPNPQEDIELESTHRWPRNHGSQQSC